MTNADEQPTNQMISAHVGQQIRRLRQRRGMSRQKLADAIGVTHQQVQKYESGANRVSASMLYRIMGHLGAELGEVFDGLGSTHREGMAGDDFNVSTVAARDIAHSMSRLDPVIRTTLTALISALEHKDV